MKNSTQNGGASFLLNARGSLVELDEKEIESVSGACEVDDCIENNMECNSYSNADGCDYTWTYDP